MNLFWRNNQDVQLGDVGQRINLIAQIYSQRSPAQQKKRDIRAQKRGHLHQSRRHQLFPRQPQVPQQRRGGIARSPARYTRFFSTGSAESGWFPSMVSVTPPLPDARNRNSSCSEIV